MLIISEIVVNCKDKMRRRMTVPHPRKLVIVCLNPSPRWKSRQPLIILALVSVMHEKGKITTGMKSDAPIAKATRSTVPEFIRNNGFKNMYDGTRMAK
jgi:hypothetical protein